MRGGAKNKKPEAPPKGRATRGAGPTSRFALRVGGHEGQRGGGHAVVEGVEGGGGAAQTKKTMAGLGEVDGRGRGGCFEEVGVFQVGGWGLAGGAGEGDGARHGGQAGAKAANLIGQAHADD